MNLGSRLKQHLEARGWTVTQFAKDAAIPAQTLYALINRDSNKADMDILLKILAALEMDFFTFMGMEAHTKPMTETVIQTEASFSAPEEATPFCLSAELYEKVVALAAEEGITEEPLIAQVLNEYVELGFGYRQRPLRSILRDSKPKQGRSSDMDSFLL
ncbi:MAG: XRE family transcriptional regulator [Eubacterium sp.]|nr:XRE family transcriptional regulator [Eubacterium sp.]